MDFEVPFEKPVLMASFHSPEVEVFFSEVVRDLIIIFIAVCGVSAIEDDLFVGGVIAKQKKLLRLIVRHVGTAAAHFVDLARLFLIQRPTQITFFAYVLQNKLHVVSGILRPRAG